MGFQATVYQVLIASPGDVEDERRELRDLIHDWNAMFAADFKVVLLPVLWETHAVPEMGVHPQAIINKQIVDRCDILVGVFWTRLGTPTPSAESGTAEEIFRFIEQKKPVLLYFSSREAALDTIDLKEWERLKEFKARIREKGLYSSFRNTETLRELATKHLTKTVKDLAERGSPTGEGRIVPLTLPSMNSEEQRFWSAYETFARELALEWRVERDSSTPSFEEGKMILRKASDQLLRLATNPVVSTRPGLASALSTLLRELRSLQQHQLFLDGGKSWNEFWDRGTDLATRIESIPKEFRQGGPDEGSGGPVVAQS